MLGHRQSVMMSDRALQFHEALLEDSLLMMQHGDQIADHVELRVQLMLACHLHKAHLQQLQLSSDVEDAQIQGQLWHTSLVCRQQILVAPSLCAKTQGF